MRNMNPNFSLKNFRSFGEAGAVFELAPITVLTGCNSAGKSSLVKALMLLSENVENGTFSIGHVGNVKFSTNLSISSMKLCLGGYNSVAHEDGDITMSYSVWSVDLQEYIVVTRKYRAKRNDALNEGTLDSLTVKMIDGRLIFHAERNMDSNLDNIPYPETLRSNFCKFYAVGCYMKVLELLPAIKRKEKDPTSTQTISSEQALNVVKDKIKSVGVTESEAISLWNEFSHDTFKTVMNAVKLRAEDVRLSDVLRKHSEDEEDWDLMLESFIGRIVTDACSPNFTQQVTYVNSASAQISRLYSVEDENKMCVALREYNNRKIAYSEAYSDTITCCEASYEPRYEPGSFMNKWIKEFGIGDSVEIKGTEEGLGLMVYLIKGAVKRLLADEGYGITQLVSLMLQIDNCIRMVCEEKFSYKPDTSRDIEVTYKYLPHTICVEEPELHLHPKYQSLLAEMFVEAYQKYNICFIIETHSEYLIRKFQVMVADKNNTLASGDVSLNYVEKDDNGVSSNRKIEILDDGRLASSFGSGFFDEATGLSMNLLKMIMESK